MAAICAAIFIFYPAIFALFRRWQEPVSYFDHAVFIPFVCIWMFFRSREKASQNRSGKLLPRTAFVLLLFALLLEFFGSAQQITFLQGAALVLWIWASVFWFGGTRSLKIYRWPLAYLTLLIPIPTFFMASLTLRMRELSTTLAAGCLHFAMAVFRLPFARLGNELLFANHRVTIVDACSGMNTLLTVIAVGMVLVYIETSRIKAWLITALLIPTAILANLIRILVICFFVAINQEYFAFESGHTLIGLTTVGIAFCILAFGIRLPQKWELKRITPSVQLAQKFSDSIEYSHFRLLTFTVLLICGALLSFRVQNSAAPIAGPKPHALPHFNPSMWKSTELPMDETTYDIIGTRDAHMFRFENAAPAIPVFLYWVHSQNSRKIGHPPELCYQSDAYDIIEKTQIKTGVNGRMIPMNRLLVKRGDDRLLVYYWYRIGGVETASYLEQQLRWAGNQLKYFAFINGNQEGTMIRVSTEIEKNILDSDAIHSADIRLKNWIFDEDPI